MQMTAFLAPGVDDREMAHQALRADIHVSPLSTYCMTQTSRRGLYLGFSAIPEPRINKAAERLATVLNDAKTKQFKFAKEA
jgi:GntR family transcriptional regulator/MocR family aminotransferase